MHFRIFVFHLIINHESWENDIKENNKIRTICWIAIFYNLFFFSSSYTVQTEKGKSKKWAAYFSIPILLPYFIFFKPTFLFYILGQKLVFIFQHFDIFFVIGIGMSSKENIYINLLYYIELRKVYYLWTEENLWWWQNCGKELNWFFFWFDHHSPAPVQWHHLLSGSSKYRIVIIGIF